MALLYIDGFEYTSINDFNNRWDVGTPTLLPTGGRDNSGAVTSSNSIFLKTVNLPVGVDIIVGVAFKTTIYTATPIYIRTNSGDYFNINIGSDYIGLFSGFSNIDTIVYEPQFIDEWNYVELKLQISPSISANSCVVRLNGVEVINLPEGSDTANIGSTRINHIQLWAFDCIFDDLYICDSTGLTNNDFLGDCKVKAIRPAADGTYTDGVPSTGTSHYSVVNGTTYTPGTGIQLATVGDKESFRMTQLTTSSIYNGTIHGIQLSSTTVRYDGKGVPEVANLIIDGATETELPSSIIPYATASTSTTQIISTDLNSAPWTAESINSAEFGIVIK